MKSLPKCLAVLCLVMQGTLLQAQGWAPVNPAYTYVYTKGNLFSDLVTVKTDSVVTSSTAGVLYHLGRIVKPWPIAIYHYTNAYAPVFLKKTCLAAFPGSFSFQDPGEFRFHSLASLDSSWIFDQTQGITATVSGVYTDTLSGVPDSIKCITLSTGDSVWLSKEHGIIRFQVPGESVEYNLVGINELNWGYRIPGFSAFVDFHVNDVFEYEKKWHSINFHHDYFDDRWYQHRILRKTINPGSVSFEVEHIERVHEGGVSYNQYGYDTLYHSQGIDTLTFTEAGLSFLNEDNFQLITSPLNSNILVLFFRFSAEWSVNAKMFNSNHLDLITEDSAYVGYYPMGNISMEYGEGIGLINWSKFTFDWYTTTTDNIRLAGYIRDGVTWGSLHDPGWILGENEMPEARLLNIFPNPAADAVWIEGPPNLHDGLLTLCNLQGQVVLSTQFQGIRQQIDLSRVVSGFYFVSLEYQRQRVTGKLLVNH